MIKPSSICRGCDWRIRPKRPIASPRPACAVPAAVVAADWPAMAHQIPLRRSAHPRIAAWTVEFQARQQEGNMTQDIKQRANWIEADPRVRTRWLVGVATLCTIIVAILAVRLVGDP